MRTTARRYEARWKILRERIEAMKAIWTQREADLPRRDGLASSAIVAARSRCRSRIRRSTSAARFPGGMQRALRYGDGWMPLLGRGDDDVASQMPAFRRAAADAGRDPDSMEVTLYACPPDPELVARCADAGVARIVFRLPNEGRRRRAALPRPPRCARARTVSPGGVPEHELQHLARLARRRLGFVRVRQEAAVDHDGDLAREPARIRHRPDLAPLRAPG